MGKPDKISRPNTRGRPVSAKSRHRTIAEDLRHRIRNGTWPPGTVLPSRKELATKYRTGLGAVQLAVETLKKEGQLVLTPHRRLVVADARMSGGEPARRILEIMTINPMLLLKNLPYAEMQTGIAIGAGELFSPLHLYFDVDFRKTVPMELLAGPMKGIVIVGKLKSSALRTYATLGVPVVVADRPKTKYRVHTASLDNRTAAQDAVRRLHALGHRKIAFIRRMHLDMREVEPDSMERQQGFLLGMKAATGKNARANIYSFFPKDTSSAPGVRGIIENKPAYTAVLAADAGPAETLVKAARSVGLSIPRDLSICSFTSKGLEQNVFTGPYLDMEEIGRQAVHLLEFPPKPSKHICIPAVWREGKTVGPAR